MLAELTVRPHGASTRVFEGFFLNPQLDLIGPGSSHLCRDRPSVLSYGLDLSIDEIVLVALERPRACHAAKGGAVKKGLKR